MFCSPEIVRQFPVSLIYCLIYLVATTIVVALGYYLYFKRLIREKVDSKTGILDGHALNQQNSKEQSSYPPILRGLFSRRSNSATELHEVPLFVGSK